MAKTGANPEAMDNMIQILTRFIDLQDTVVEVMQRCPPASPRFSC